ncbi:MAG: hydantoinase B/oxoprolinase family protein [Deltaproteobacteria bacterium]|nr:hydantoinase B/oxoprolinase family protein [Deltaproteobacteria bacterium]
MEGAGAVDPVTLEVVRNALVAYADEMAAVLCKTAYNLMIYEVRDYCVGLVDPEGGIIAQNTGGLPIFLADLGVAIQDGVRRHSRDGFRPGDVLIMNYPYVCGQHLNNVVIYTPCFHEGELVAFPAVRAHWLDIGGTRIGFGSNESTEIYQEGLQFRSLKLYREGVVNTDLLQMIRDNIRFPDSSLGDLRAQLAACRLGERRLAELFGRYGRETVRACIRTIWDQSEALARQAMARLPDGVYEAESFMDNDGMDLGRPVRIHVRVEIAGDEMTVDFSGVDGQVRGSINCGESGAVAAARVAFKCVTLPDAPVDEGGFRPLRVVVPRGRFLNALPPAAMGQWSIPLPTVIDTILRALAPAMPDRVPAGHKGDMSGYALYGVEARSGERFVCMNIMGGGWGGRPHEDGESAAVSVCQGDVRNVPVELQEMTYPILVEAHRLRQDSGGPGRFRGGLGVELWVRCLQPMLLNVNVERTRCPPWGLWGGRPGAVNAVLLRESGQPEARPMGKLTRFPLKAGDVIGFLTAGGGGYGPPIERAPEQVRLDAIRGYLSQDCAREEYGVVLAPDTLEIDQEATAALRATRRHPDPA